MSPREPFDYLRRIGIKRMKIVEPSSSDIWRQGSKYDIIWEKWGDLDPLVNIGLLRLTDMTEIRRRVHPYVIATKAPNSGKYTWKIPMTIGTGRYFMGIITADMKVYDMSELFHILHTDVLTLTAGERSSYAVMASDGCVYGWGINGSIGLLGDGVLQDSSETPVKVSGLTGVIEIAASSDYVLALDRNGEVWSWGRNTYGNLGDGTTTDRATPVKVQGLSGVVKIAALKESVALKSDGTVWVWGYNAGGIGENLSRTTPVQIQGVGGVKDIAAGGMHSMAVDGDGNVWSWGSNPHGELGNGTTSNFPSGQPVQAQNLTGVDAVAAGTYHSLALKNDGTVWAWGENVAGQLGDGTGFTEEPHPIAMQTIGLSGVKAIKASYRQSFAIKNDNTLWAWGWNGFGQFGNGTTSLSFVPIQVQTGVKNIAAGYGHSLFLMQNGDLYASGLNQNGQLGDGTFTNRVSPVTVQI